MNQPATLSWFARHELLLLWRDWFAMMTFGKRQRTRTLIVIIVIALVIMHALAIVFLKSAMSNSFTLSIVSLIFIGTMVLVSFSLMLSQSMEAITRVFYARNDLDLIMSSPVMVQRLFAVRISAVAITTSSMSLLLAFPLINTMVFREGPHWLASYGVMAAMAALSVAISLIVVILLLVVIGPGYTRFVSQLIAAIVGAGFIISVQIVAILSYGSMSRVDSLLVDIAYKISPDMNSLWWIPIRAMTGDWQSFVITMIIGFGALGLTIKLVAPQIGRLVLSATSISRHSSEQKTRMENFRQLTPIQTLRHKEWILLKRDPWLISQTLMQILYLLPPILLLWRNFSGLIDTLAIVAPVIVMATGQLAGGLAWLAISGEDAHDLISTAPVRTGTIIRAKIEAVILCVFCIIAPFVIALAFANFWIVLIIIIGVVIVSFNSIIIQFWFRKQAKRTHFRRRQTSSRTATFAEAFSSIFWAGTTAAAVAGALWHAIILAVLAIIVLIITRTIAPPQEVVESF